MSHCNPPTTTKTMFTLIQQYSQKVKAGIQGGIIDLEEESPSELNAGAKIKKIFFEKLPLMILIERNDLQLRNQIRITIENSLGLSSGYFMPDQRVFGKIARQEIEKLRHPSLEIVDLVVGEFMKFLRENTKFMRDYPRLEEEVERIVAKRVRDQEQEAKKQVNYLIDTELVSMNASHEDFKLGVVVGKVTGKQETGRKHMKSNQNRVLENVTQQSRLQENRMPENRMPANRIQANRRSIKKLQDHFQDVDFNLERQVDEIKSHVESYLKIVRKTIKDQVPKIIMFTIVNNLLEYCKTELVADICENGIDFEQFL